MNVTLLQNLGGETFVLLSRHFLHSHCICLSLPERRPPFSRAALRMRTTPAHAQCAGLKRAVQMGTGYRQTDRVMVLASIAEPQNDRIS